jgi:hypothetical protein
MGFFLLKPNPEFDRKWSAVPQRRTSENSRRGGAACADDASASFPEEPENLGFECFLKTSTFFS